MTNPKKTETEKLSFEQALEELEQIVSEIEQGKVPLEESIDKYARGIELIRRCRSILATAEKKIQLLARAEGETLAAAGELGETEPPSESQEE